ncbi:MAG: hypothetical protein GYA57_10165 [Myxococcales bacterium]|nr:hypothetical protein [Myxococcales bacterium]
MMRKTTTGALLATLLFGFGCADLDAGDEENPFLDDMSNGGKEDTGYLNPDGIEVEVDLEGDVEASSYRLFEAPAEVGQYAMTYLRHRGQFYLEGLAEDATSDERVEWQVGGEWWTAAEARRRPAAELRHWRIRGVNAVLLRGAGSNVEVGTVFTARVPLKPFTVMADAGDKCADPDGHITLGQSVYWYLWNPDRSGCTLPTQDLKVTVSRMFSTARTTYPEYDQLVADGRITAVVLFGQIGDGPIDDSEAGVRNMNRMARNLLSAGFSEVTPAPVGRRFSKMVAGVEMLFDLYSPRDFSGLGDFAHFGNFQRALSEHEIVAYDGHSMLGASDFWSRPNYPDFYQIYLYGGCLGYEYYVRPILAGKGGWAKVDIVSSVVEVSADANAYAAPFLSKLMWAVENRYNASWTDLLAVIRRHVGDSTFGASGVRDNCFSPNGTLCGEEPPPPPTGETKVFENAAATPIPDDDDTGVVSTIVVPESFVPRAVAVELDLTHTYVGDLRIVLTHDGVEHVLWDNAGGSDENIRGTFETPIFHERQAAGDWVLRVSDTYARDVGTLNRWAIRFGL